MVEGEKRIESKRGEREMKGRWKGDEGETKGRRRGDEREMKGRWKGDEGVRVSITSHVSEVIIVDFECHSKTT